MTADREWRALHVHLPHSQHTAYLTDVVHPALDESGLIGDFFFLRYWRGGPHLRLRLRSGPGAADPAAVETLFETLAAAPWRFDEGARSEYALGLTAQQELARLEGETVSAPMPLGAHVRTPYAPEYEKYGGVAGVAIAERVFCETSAIVMEMLREARGRNRDGERPPLGEALKVMAISLSAAGLTDEEARLFLRRYDDWWRAYASPEHARTWPALYDRLSGHVVELCRDAWEGAGGDALFQTIARATDEARALSGSGPQAPVDEILLDGTPFSRCLANYVHTTNNRLGLVPAGESLVAYLLHRGLQEYGDAQRDPRRAGERIGARDE